MESTWRGTVALFLMAALVGCEDSPEVLSAECTTPDCAPCFVDGSCSPEGKADQGASTKALNLRAGRMVIYEAQVRSANACREDMGSAAQR